MGKNFSGVNKGQRKASDFYETPYSMTEQFLALGYLDRDGLTLEPACGAGAITKVLEKCGFSNVVSYDADRDFLTEAGQYDQVITNPPFSLAYEFIIKAKQVAASKIAFLLPLSYLHGKARYDDIWRDKVFGLKRVCIFTRYPMLGDQLRDDGMYRTGMMVYAWYVWEHGYSGNPFIEWIDNDRFVIGSKTARAALGEDK